MKVEIRVTGATQGLGLAIARRLCDKFPGRVYLTGRDEKKGSYLVRKIRNTTDCNAKFYAVDVRNTSSIEEFREYLEINEGGIDVIVNNAAIAYERNATEPFSEQAEETIATNFFALLNVCLILFTLLRDHARIVNLSSSLGHLSQIPGKHLREKFADPNLSISQLEELMFEFINATKRGDHISEGWGGNAYAVSKVGVTALTRIQQKVAREMALNASQVDILVNACHPGDVKTRMSSYSGYFTPEQGAIIPVALTMIPDYRYEPGGRYIWCDGTIVDWVNGPVPGPCINRTFSSYSIHKSLYKYYKKLFKYSI